MRTTYGVILGAMAGLAIAALPLISVALCADRAALKALLFLPALPARWLLESLSPAPGDKGFSIATWLGLPFWMAIGATLGFFLVRRRARRSGPDGG